jgi:hypothetical protein
MAQRAGLMQGDLVTLGERIEEQSFCYDPDFPPEVPEGQPLTAAKAAPHHDATLRRAMRACGNAAAAVKKRARSGG